MALVVHKIRNNSGKGEERLYLYEHYRVGDTVKSDYVRPVSPQEAQEMKAKKKKKVKRKD